MMSQSSSRQPPRVAVWLVDLFTSTKQQEAVLGDLLEEFSDLASNSGAASARRWYWRQSAKTIAHLIYAEFDSAPWWIAAVVLGGFLWLRFEYMVPERAIVALLDLHENHVIPYRTQSQMDAFMFWFNASILAGRLGLSLSIGCVVGVAARGKEMLATMTMALILTALTMQILWLFAARQSFPVSLAGEIVFLISTLATPLMFVLGGVIVRKTRSAFARRLPAGA